MFHNTPPGIKTGIFVADKWLWEKADWTRCRCGLFHSNRVIPNDYWNKWSSTPLYPKKTRYVNGIILSKGDKIFTTQSYSNLFGFPKGNSEENEFPIVGALREFKEETGTDLEQVFPFKDFTACPQITWFNSISKVHYHFFIINLYEWFDIRTTPKDDIEITSFGWISVSDIGKKGIKFSVSMLEICEQFKDYRSSSSHEEFIDKRNSRLDKKTIKLNRKFSI
jgi:8-oxo-dGTP pyrophosphatase MutT (NUDIX family)